MSGTISCLLVSMVNLIKITKWAEFNHPVSNCQNNWMKLKYCCLKNLDELKITIFVTIHSSLLKENHFIY